MIDVLTLSANQALLQSILRKDRRGILQSQQPEPPTPQVLSSATVSISAFGKQINNMYSALGEIKDEQTREAARNGMRAMVQSLASKNEATRILAFNQSLNELSDIAPDSFRQVFTQAEAIASRALDVDKWLSTLLELDDQQLRQDHLSITESIIDSGEKDAVIADTFAQYMASSGQLMAAQPDTAVRRKTLAQLFDAVQTQSTMTGKQQAMTSISAAPTTAIAPSTAELSTDAA